MLYLVQKVFKVWSELIVNFVKYVFRFKHRNRGTVVGATINPERNISDMDDFTCECNISGDLTEALKAKGVCMNRNMKCTSPIEPVYFRCENSEKICAWCSKPLNEDSVKKLKQKLQTHSTVQPNCGEKSCLKRNAGGPNGWTILRPKVKRKTKPKKPKPKAPKRKVPPGGSPSGKRRKQGN